ncbi:hypothetical protein HKD37_05G012817 [Glycine soja]
MGYSDHFVHLAFDNCLTYYIGLKKNSVEIMADNNRTLKERTTPDVVYQAWCIQYPKTKVSYELNFGLTHLMPRFQGLAGEDPHKHMKEFHVMCSTMQPGQPFRPQQQQYNPYSNTYNPGWRDHPNLRELPKPIDVGAKIDDVSAITLKSDREIPKPTDAGAKINDVSDVTLKSDREPPKPTDVGAKIDDVSVVTLKSDRELPKPTYVGAKIDDVSVITLKSDRELPKPTDAGAKIDDSAKKNFAPKQIPLSFHLDPFL